MNDMQRKRAFVGQLYSSPRWKKRVNKMTDAQIIGIYLSHQQDPKKAKPPEKKKESGSDDIPF